MKLLLGALVVISTMVASSLVVAAPYSYTFESGVQEQYFSDVIYGDVMGQYIAVGQDPDSYDLTHITAYDDTGAVNWTRRLHGPAKDVVDVEIYNGEYIVMAANFYDTHTDTLYPVVTMFDSSGTVVWVKKYSDQYRDLIRVRDMATIVGDNYIYLVGELANDPDDDVWLAKIDNNGDMLWQAYYTSDDVRLTNEVGMAVKGFGPSSLAIGGNYETLEGAAETGLLFLEVSRNNGALLTRFKHHAPGYERYLHDIDVSGRDIAFTGWTHRPGNFNNPDLLVGVFDTVTQTFPLNDKVNYTGQGFPERGYGIFIDGNKLYISGELDDRGEYSKNSQGILLRYDYSTGLIDWSWHFGLEEDDFFRGINPGPMTSSDLVVSGAFNYSSYSLGWLTELPMSTGVHGSTECLRYHFITTDERAECSENEDEVKAIFIEPFDDEPNWELVPLSWNVMDAC